MTAVIISLDAWRCGKHLVHLVARGADPKTKRKPKEKARKPAPRYAGYLPVNAVETIQMAEAVMLTLPLKEAELAFVLDMRERAERYGENFGMTERQLAWFKAIAARLQDSVKIG